MQPKSNKRKSPAEVSQGAKKAKPVSENAKQTFENNKQGNKKSKKKIKHNSKSQTENVKPEMQQSVELKNESNLSQFAGTSMITKLEKKVALDKVTRKLHTKLTKQTIINEILDDLFKKALRQGNEELIKIIATKLDNLKLLPITLSVQRRMNVVTKLYKFATAKNKPESLGISLDDIPDIPSQNTGEVKSNKQQKKKQKKSKTQLKESGNNVKVMEVNAESDDSGDEVEETIKVENVVEDITQELSVNDDDDDSEENEDDDSEENEDDDDSEENEDQLETNNVNNKAATKKTKNSNGLPKNNVGSPQKGQSRYIVFVGNLPFDIEIDGIKNHFNKAGPVKDVRIQLDRVTNKPRGFAFVEFNNEEEYQVSKFR